MGVAQKDPLVALAVFALCVVTIPIAIAAGLVILAPFIAAGILWYWGPTWWKWYKERPTPVAKLHDIAKQQIDYAKFPETETYVFSLMKPFILERATEAPSLDLCAALNRAVIDLYNAERFADVPPEPVPEADQITKARHRDQLLAYLKRTGDPALLDTFGKTIINSYTRFHKLLPKAALTDTDTYLESDSEGKIAIPLLDLIAEPGEMVMETIRHFYDEKAIELGLFKDLRQTIDRNVKIATAHQTKAKDAEVLPPDYKGPPRELVHAYLQDTPLEELFYTAIPFTIPQHLRFQHHWIVAPPGAGKSVTLQYFINRDLELVQRNEASIIIIDSNRDLIKAVEGLKVFAPGEPLHGKLLSIDMEDVDYLPSINLFDTGSSAGLSPLARESLRNTVLELYDYFFNALLGADLTSRQSTLFTFTIQLLLEIPGATLDTLIELMQPGGVGKYAQYLDNLDADAKSFFQLKFSEKSYDATKTQVADRLFGVKKIRTLAKMFASPKSKLDFFKELQSSKVITINVPTTLLADTGVEIIGRFFIAMILLAAQKRMLQPQEHRKPTFVYIDECQDIIKRDTKIPVILDQARKLNVGVVLAHQRLRQLEPYVLDALYGATAIKFATQVSDAAAHALARDMRCTPEFIQTQPPYHFAAFVRGITDTAVSLSIPEIDMLKMPRMTAADASAIRDDTRARYSTLRDLPRPNAGGFDAPQQTTSTASDPLVNLHHPDLPWKLEKDVEPKKPGDTPRQDDDWRS